MAESLSRIHATLRALSRRELRNLFLQAFFGAIAAWLLAWAVLAIAVSWDVARPASGTLWIAGLVASGLVAAAVPLQIGRAHV